MDDQIAYIIELHPYSSLDNLSSLAYKLEQQRKSKGKNPLFKPYTQPYPSLGTPNTFPTPQGTLNPRLTPPTAQTPPQRTHSNSKEKMRCFRCQGLDTFRPDALTRELSLWPNIKLPLESLKRRRKKEGNRCVMESHPWSLVKGP